MGFNWREALTYGIDEYFRSTKQFSNYDAPSNDNRPEKSPGKCLARETSVGA